MENGDLKSPFLVLSIVILLSSVLLPAYSYANSNPLFKTTYCMSLSHDRTVSNGISLLVV